MNPTNGSWWIVQIVSKWERQNYLALAFALPDRREDLNHPPTAVGGICTDARAASEVEKI